MRLEHVILGLLAVRPFSGYDMRKWMEGKGKYLGYEVQLPQIYRTLPKLVANGWAEFDVDPREGRPDAKVYRITEAGREELLAWARSPYEPSPSMADSDFRLRFLFTGQLGPEFALDLLRTEIDYRIAHVGGPGWLDFHVTETSPDSLVDAAWANSLHLAAHEFGYSTMASYIAWLQLTLARLEVQAGLPPSRTPYRGRPEEAPGS
ncbi:PadR family transcriptional regulator [Streptacidiphilus fuscans]|uniref:PadR family transcriptional regulator n=1 Tax=Streptacidiphilus fuscans TaxID=2789292 RepID=A0A931B5I9_9ACTN|nr:PadR family transcriptional regulator [Streptacidiphilus fuscans]MBF9069042.1 PadR family transcriptional regulator [Streptacidiphilus fuscans]